jgi:hypothetical protein
MYTCTDARFKYFSRDLGLTKQFQSLHELSSDELQVAIRLGGVRLLVCTRGDFYRDRIAQGEKGKGWYLLANDLTVEEISQQFTGFCLSYYVAKC